MKYLKKAAFVVIVMAAMAALWLAGSWAYCKSKSQEGCKLKGFAYAESFEDDGGDDD